MKKEDLNQLHFDFNLAGINRKKRPHPLLLGYQPVTVRDILVHPLNRHFQGRVHQWVLLESQTHDFRLRDVLPDHNLEYFHLYFFPQPDGNWLTQSEVLGHKNTSGFRTLMQSSLVRIYRRIMYGPGAMEILKPNHLIYLSLIRYNKNTLEEVGSCTPADFKKICGSRNIFNQLVAQIKEHNPHWQPPAFLFASEESTPEPIKR